MKRIYTGKTKDVYALNDDTYLLQFKDDVTGEDGKFDPGSDKVGLTMDGAGRAGLQVTKYFFEMLKDEGIPTHYLDANLNKATMTVKRAEMFGEGIEVICRYRAVGSFFQRYGKYVEAGQPLEGFIEFTLKDDERGDPPINKDALIMLGIMLEDEYEQLKKLTTKIAKIVKNTLAERSIELYDIKLEFGKVGKSRDIVLIDEISGGNMRAYKGNQFIKPLELPKLLF